MNEGINGAFFELSAETVKGGFYGRWICLECGGTGKSNHLDVSEKRAIAAVRIGASFHAGAKHPKKD